MRRRIGAAAFLALFMASPALGEEFRSSLRADPGGTLRVRLDRGALEVESHAEPEVRVDAQYSGAMEFELRGGDGEVELVGRSSRLGLGALFGQRVRVRVRVPQRFSVDLDTKGGSIEVERLEGSVRAETSGGFIAVEGARGPVDLRTRGGSIRAEDVAGDLEARTSGGNIDARGVAGRVEARTSGGSLELLDVVGPVDARSSGGSVRVRFRGPPEGSLRTSGGNVDAVFPRGAGAQVDARTSGGRITLEDPLRLDGSSSRDRMRGRVGGGGAPLELRTSGGNIRIRVE
jgi:hypothetical protein